MSGSMKHGRIERRTSYPDLRRYLNFEKFSMFAAGWGDTLVRWQVVVIQSRESTAMLRSSPRRAKLAVVQGTRSATFAITNRGPERSTPLSSWARALDRKSVV